MTRSPDAPKAFDSACYAPFVAMEFDPQGRVFTCCTNQLYPMGNVAESSLREIWHGRHAEHPMTLASLPHLADPSRIDAQGRRVS